jgi:hypothetical protein
MAAVIPFDTLAYARKLESAGVAKPQAEAQATALADAFRQAVASPDDLKMVEANLESKIMAVEGNLASKIAAVESRVALVEARLDAKIDAKFDKLAAILDTHRWVLALHMAMTVAIVVRLFAFP